MVRNVFSIRYFKFIILIKISLLSIDVSNFSVPFFDKPPPKKSDKVAMKKTVHEQEDGTILAVAATGTSSKNSLLSWVYKF